jgi:hypothetical protein
MVTNGGAQAVSGIWHIFIVKHAHTISVLNHVFHNSTLFILHTACKLKTLPSTCTPEAGSTGRALAIVRVRSLLHGRVRLNRPLVTRSSHKLCDSGDVTSKYRMTRVAAPCLLCILFFTSGTVTIFEVVFFPQERPEMLRMGNIHVHVLSHTLMKIPKLTIKGIWNFNEIHFRIFIYR